MRVCVISGEWLSIYNRGYRCFVQEIFDFVGRSEGEEGAKIDGTKESQHNYQWSVNNEVGYQKPDATRKQVSSAAANRLCKTIDRTNQPTVIVRSSDDTADNDRKPPDRRIETPSTPSFVLQGADDDSCKPHQRFTPFLYRQNLLQWGGNKSPINRVQIKYDNLNQPLFNI